MKYLKKFIQYIYCIYALIGFYIDHVCCCAFVAIFSMFGIRGGNLLTAHAIFGRGFGTL